MPRTLHLTLLALIAALFAFGGAVLSEWTGLFLLGSALLLIGSWQAVRFHLARVGQVEQEQMATKVEALGFLSAGIVHDFNNSLLVVEGNLSLMKADPKVASDRILEAVGQARTLNRHLMSLSQRRSTDPTLVDVDEHIAWLHVLICRTLPFDTRIEMDLDASGCRSLIAPLALTHALMKLVYEATRGTPESGGRFTIETRRLGQSLTVRIVESGEREPRVALSLVITRSQ